MSLNSQLPLVLLVRATGFRLCGRVCFPRDDVGAIEPGDEEDFVVFRKVVLDPAGDQPSKPGAIFRVRFQFARFSDRTNRFLSLIPLPFIVAQPGFRSKTWMQGIRSGAFQGVYEWDSVEDAEQYWDSFPMRLMRKRAAPGTLARDISPFFASPARAEKEMA